MESNEDILNHQRVWESLILPKGYHIEKQLSGDQTIFFVIKGRVCFEKNDFEVHSVLSKEMFVAQIDSSYKITMMEQTHIMTCHVPFESLFIEQKCIEEFLPANSDFSDNFYKLPVKKTIVRFLSLIDTYLKEGIHINHFFEIKRQELLYLLFHYYQKSDLAQFLQPFLSKDMQFKKFVVENYLYARNVGELAKLANYSTSGFIKKFQKCFSDSPYRWMQRQRAKQIYIDIYKGKKSLQEIANEYRFSSYQHFSVFCKAQLGASPTSIFEKSSKRTE